MAVEHCYDLSVDMNLFEFWPIRASAGSFNYLLRHYVVPSAFDDRKASCNSFVEALVMNHIFPHCVVLKELSIFLPLWLDPTWS